jgi:hypothetical protein
MLLPRDIIEAKRIFPLTDRFTAIAQGDNYAKALRAADLWCLSDAVCNFYSNITTNLLPSQELAGLKDLIAPSKNFWISVPSDPEVAENMAAGVHIMSDDNKLLFLQLWTKNLREVVAPSYHLGCINLSHNIYSKKEICQRARKLLGKTSPKFNGQYDLWDDWEERPKEVENLVKLQLGIGYERARVEKNTRLQEFYEALFADKVEFQSFLELNFIRQLTLQTQLDDKSLLTLLQKTANRSKQILTSVNNVYVNESREAVHQATQIVLGALIVSSNQLAIRHSVVFENEPRAYSQGKSKEKPMSRVVNLTLEQRDKALKRIRRLFALLNERFVKSRIANWQLCPAPGRCHVDTGSRPYDQDKVRFLPDGTHKHFRREFKRNPLEPMESVHKAQIFEEEK